jgi:DNA-binding winged helix-turn-helix (wHTH) protein
MRYIIDEKIIFNTDDNSIIPIDNYDNISPRFFSAVGARLLELFITHNHRCLLRDSILEEVWDKHGLHSSGNSLNNNISIVRKILLEFDIEGVIITNPKVGFTANFESIILDDSLQKIKDKKFALTKWAYANLTLLSVFAACLIMNLTYVINSNLDKSDDSYITTERIGNCLIHYKNEIPIREKIISYCRGNPQANVYIYNPIKSRFDINKKFEIICNNGEGALCISDSIMDYTK